MLCSKKRLILLHGVPPAVDDMLHVGVFGRVQLDVILGQDLHDGPNFQPPLRLRDPVPAEKTEERDGPPLF